MARSFIATGCLNAFSVSGTFAPSVIVATGNRFVDWVDSKYPGAQWLTEIPITTTRAAGGNWNGTLDLVLELADGTFVILSETFPRRLTSTLLTSEAS